MSGIEGVPAWLPLLRGVHDVALLSLLGALAFAPCVLPRELHGGMAVKLRRLAWVSGVLALGLGAVWFLAEAAIVDDARGIAAALGAVPAFVAYLQFGQVLLAQLVLLAATLALMRLPWAALVLAALATGVQPWLGHAGQMSDALAGSEVVHLLAAGVWLGGLVPLLLCLAVLPAALAARAFRRFTTVGLAAVLALAASGAAQGWVMAGGMAGLIGSAYGRVALLKAALFALALALAARNGLVLTPRLPRAPGAPLALTRSVALEALIGVAIVLAAGWLAGLPPAAG